MSSYPLIDLSRNVSILNQKFRHCFDAVFSKSGITGTQATILYFISRHDQETNVYQRDIESAFHIRRSSVTSVLQGLEHHGYLLRESVPADCRLKKLVLTDKSTAILDELQLRVEEINKTALKGLSSDEIQLFHAMIEQICTNLDTTEPP